MMDFRSSDGPVYKGYMVARDGSEIRLPPNARFSLNSHLYALSLASSHVARKYREIATDLNVDISLYDYDEATGTLRRK